MKATTGRNCNWILASLIACVASVFVQFSGAPLAISGPLIPSQPSTPDFKFSWKDKNGNQIPDQENRRSKDNFGAQLLLTNDKELWTKWYTLPSEVAPRISTVATAKRNVPVLFPIIFANPKLDQAGNVDLSCDFAITKPDGKVERPPKAVLWKGKYPAKVLFLQLGQAGVGYVVENTDPKGKYSVSAIVRDNVRKLELPLRTSFTVE